MTQDKQNTASECYSIELTSEQCATVSIACEILSRLGMGQFRAALEHLPVVRRKRQEWHEDMKTIGTVLSKHTEVDDWSTSHSISSEVVPERAKTAWDIFQTLRQRIAWDNAIIDGIIESHESPRNWGKMADSCYDDPIQVGKQPLAKIEPK